MRILLAALLFTSAQDAENPDYKRWASFKAGSWVKMKSEVEGNGNKMATPIEVTYTLLELDEKQAVVEETTVNTALPKDSPKQEKSRKRTHRAAQKKKDVVDTEGDEELEIGGKKLPCHWVALKPAVGGQVGLKTWSNPDVPGNVVRMDVTMAVGINRLTAVEWEKK